MQQKQSILGKGISGAALKWLAIVCMAIDHTGATVALQLVYHMVRTGNYTGYKTMYQVYYIMRYIGRFSFPVYCFLLVEGFAYTRNRMKYLRNLLIFAIVSEIPFDLAFENTLFETDHQNVFLTLAIGLAAIWAVDCLRMKTGAWMAQKNMTNACCQAAIRLVGDMLIIVPAASLAWLLNTDYDATGIAVIYVCYLLRGKKLRAAIAGVAVLTAMQAIEIFSCPSILAIGFYNGTRGRQMKYFFYLFYPLHLLLLYAVCVGLGFY